jgi:hypothetical protein
MNRITSRLSAEMSRLGFGGLGHALAPVFSLPFGPYFGSIVLK